MQGTKTKTIRLLFLGLLACMLNVTAWSQHRVNGVVTDDGGRPLLGAQVVESGNETNGTRAGSP